MPSMRIAMTKATQLQTPNGPVQQATTIPDPGVLVLQGPQLPATILRPDGRPPLGGAPAHIGGNALIDTGAQTTSIDLEAAQRAGLPTRGKGKTHSATHMDQECPLLAGQILLPNGLTLNGHGMLGLPLGKLGLIALIGRDLLAHCILIYDGGNATCTLSW